MMFTAPTTIRGCLKLLAQIYWNDFKAMFKRKKPATQTKETFSWGEGDTRSIN